MLAQPCGGGLIEDFAYATNFLAYAKGRRMSRPSIADRIASECVMSRWRMTNRVLAGIYDEEFRPFGLKSPQLSLLVAISKAGPVRRTRLGELLSLDPSTLTRNLQVMLRQGGIGEG